MPEWALWRLSLQTHPGKGVKGWLSLVRPQQHSRQKHRGDLPSYIHMEQSRGKLRMAALSSEFPLPFTQNSTWSGSFLPLSWILSSTFSSQASLLVLLTSQASPLMPFHWLFPCLEHSHSERGSKATPRWSGLFSHRQLEPCYAQARDQQTKRHLGSCQIQSLVPTQASESESAFLTSSPGDSTIWKCGKPQVRIQLEYHHLPTCHTGRPSLTITASQAGLMPLLNMWWPVSSHPLSLSLYLLELDISILLCLYVCSLWSLSGSWNLSVWFTWVFSGPGPMPDNNSSGHSMNIFFPNKLFYLFFQLYWGISDKKNCQIFKVYIMEIWYT